MQTKAPPQSYITSSTTARSRSNGYVILSARPCLRPSIRSPPVPALPSICLPAPSLRRDVAARMASPNSSSTPGNLTELNDASDFDALVNPDGYLSVVGFGSLLSGNPHRPSPTPFRFLKP